jgi:hypothetical protein
MPTGERTMQQLDSLRISKIASCLLIGVLAISGISGCAGKLVSYDWTEREIAAENEDSQLSQTEQPKPETAADAVERGEVAQEIRETLTAMQQKHDVSPSEIQALEQLLLESDPILRAALLRQYKRILSNQESPEENPPADEQRPDQASQQQGQPASQNNAQELQTHNSMIVRTQNPPATAGQTTPRHSPLQSETAAVAHKPNLNHSQSPSVLNTPDLLAQQTNALTGANPSPYSASNFSAPNNFTPNISGLGGIGGTSDVHRMLDQMAQTIRNENARQASLQQVSHVATEPETMMDLAASETNRDSSYPTDPNAPTNSSPSSVQQSWQELLASAISTLEVELEQARQNQDQDRLHQLDPVLRLLYVCAGKRQEAAKEVAAATSSEKQYWRELAVTLDTQLNDRSTPAHRKDLIVLRGLRDAVRDLAEESHLDIRNLAFCQQVDSFGKYQTFKQPYEFRGGQELLLYVEVENMMAVDTSTDTETKYEVSLAGHYDIFDAAGRRVAEHQFPPDVETCRNRRQDFYIPYRIYLPSNLTSGKYTLHLHMEDTNAKKIAESAPLEFMVK